MTGSYVCEQFRLDLTRLADGGYQGFRTPLDRAATGGTLSVSAKVTERAPDRIVLVGDFARFKETFPFQATFQGTTLQVSSIFSDYRLLRIPRPADHREFAGTGFGGRPIRLVLEDEPEADRSGTATLFVDHVVKHKIRFQRSGDRLAGTVALNDRTLDFSARLQGLLLTMDIGPESYALAAIGPTAISASGLRTWVFHSAHYNAATRQLVLRVFSRTPLSEGEREDAEFRFSLLSKDGVRSTGQVAAIDLPSPRGQAKPPAGARPNAPDRRVHEAQIALPVEPSLLERSSVIKLEQSPATRPIAPR